MDLPVGLCHLVLDQRQEFVRVQLYGQFDPVVLVETHCLAEATEILFIHFEIEKRCVLGHSFSETVVECCIVLSRHFVDVRASLYFVFYREDVLPVTVLGKLDIKVPILLNLHVFTLV